MTGSRSESRSDVPSVKVDVGMDANVRGVLEEKLGVFWKERQEIHEQIREYEENLLELQSREQDLSSWIKSLNEALGFR